MSGEVVTDPNDVWNWKLLMLQDSQDEIIGRGYLTLRGMKKKRNLAELLTELVLIEVDWDDNDEVEVESLVFISNLLVNIK